MGLHTHPPPAPTSTQTVLLVTAYNKICPKIQIQFCPIFALHCFMILKIVWSFVEHSDLYFQLPITMSSRKIWLKDKKKLKKKNTLQQTCKINNWLSLDKNKHAKFRRSRYQSLYTCTLVTGARLASVEVSLTILKTGERH